MAYKHRSELFKYINTCFKKCTATAKMTEITKRQQLRDTEKGCERTWVSNV